MEAIKEQLQRLNGEIDDENAKLGEVVKQLHKHPEDKILNLEYSQMVQALAELRACRKNLEDKLQAKPRAGYMATPTHQNAEVKDIGGGMSLLSFDSNTFFPDDLKRCHHALIVRDVFPTLFELLQQQEAWLLTGVPGTGKSWFVWYAVYSLLQLKDPPSIVWQSHKFNMRRCVLFKAGKAYIGDVDSFMEELEQESTWFFTDGIMPPNVAAHTIMICSPNRSIYKEWVKGRDDITLTMPLWTWAEIEACWQCLHSGIQKLPLERVRRRFDMYCGGVPRLVLELPSRPGYNQPDDAVVKSALASTSLEQVVSALGAYDAAPEASHHIVHQDGDRSTFSQLEYCFATPHVGSLFTQQVRAKGLGAELAYYMSDEGGFSGLFWEPYAHQAFIKGGKFEYKVLSVPSSVPRTGKQGRPRKAVREEREMAVTAATGGKSMVMTQKPLEQVQFLVADKPEDIDVHFREAVESRTAPAYLQPSHGRHPCIDACVLPDRLLQITVSKKRKAVDEEILERHLQCLPPRDVYYLDYIVPASSFQTFKVADLKRTPGSRVAKTTQRVVKINCMQQRAAPLYTHALLLKRSWCAGYSSMQLRRVF
ncbi:hypothetical protein VOLCADRAFT_85820 [Volvox carteri f. nagariensis]|uniref:Uncharacterized protein n=1 Tax=Volvox carteri f. nagariensis TaxID=3068 RepID=D8TH29_VOLCA|nr:uncharacterized protein VOLCADRAFT_85820 [Volvox carteri f. nagariensis]EFJ52637.1 hypothetical protein VOLCADRAFT_85820 [Volvox carteri f. nagariensis]|eukprot:XP_002945642.1 hypothetical protein VOLCADRAFT_85820 [Volvox carteri f. nagariensis]